MQTYIYLDGDIVKIKNRHFSAIVDDLTEEVYTKTSWSTFKITSWIFSEGYMFPYYITIGNNRVKYEATGICPFLGSSDPSWIEMLGDIRKLVLNNGG